MYDLSLLLLKVEVSVHMVGACKLYKTINETWKDTNAGLLTRLSFVYFT